MGDQFPPQTEEPWQGERRYDRRWEQPVHTVSISKAFAIGRFEVTRGEFAAYVAATGREPEPGCLRRKDGQIGLHPDHTWRDLRLAQTDSHPVVCVNRRDAETYLTWLSGITGHRYRFPSEAEWEYAARAGTRSEYPWGDELGAGPANCKDCGTPFDDRSTSPAGTFASNAWGLFDMAGSVWEPTLDCFHMGYSGAPSDGSAWNDPACAFRVLRSGSWYDRGALMRSALRGRGNPANRIGDLGFRAARDIDD